MSDSRLARCFQALRAEGRRALVVYLTAQDPDLYSSVALARACLDAGADILEWGLPFSDPTADGPILQAAALRALGAGANYETVLEGARQIRQTHDAPLVLFGYVNPLLSRGVERVAGELREVGVDGALVVDAPPEASETLGLEPALVKAGVDPIYLVTPLSHEARMRRAAERSRGFVYTVSMAGVTGTALVATDAAEQTVRRIKGVTDMPVCLGFGIRDAAQAQRFAALADGVVVGSALVDLAHTRREAGDADWIATVAAQVASLRQGVDAAGAPTGE